MATLSSPVKIPDVKGKISFNKKADRTYVRYEIGRTYNSTRKNTNPQRVVIGLQIRNAPTLMLPNENYEKYFRKDFEADDGGESLRGIFGDSGGAAGG